MAIPPAQLEDTWVEYLRFETNAEFSRADSRNVSYFVEHDVEIGELVESEEDGSLSSVAGLEVHVRFAREDDPTGPLPFELDLTVEGLFKWEPELKPQRRELASAWLDYNARYLLWPYVRVHVAAITSMSRLPTLTVYTTNVPKPPTIPQGDDVPVEQLELDDGATTPAE